MKTKFNGILTLLLALLVQLSFAQEKTISGTVSDETGPLPGVNVIVKGTSNGTQTDFDGKYTLKATAGDVIVFSFVGMSTVEKTVGSSNTIDTILSTDNLLEEIVVLGYTSRGKNELTGSTVQISGADLAETPVTSVDQVLQGKVAGLSISSTSGTPGSVQNIRIRGISSITSNNEPLYVIDGVPMINGDISGYSETSNLSSLASFNGNNIESVTVLKDASATSAYGARGSNGVIVITTKNGKAGKTQFNFGTTYGWSNNAVEGQNVLSASQWDELYTEAIGSSAWDGVTDTNWGELIENKNAISKTYDLSARGGGDDYNFFTSIGYNNSEATVIGVDFERITAQLNLTKDFSDKIKYSTKNSFSTMTQDGFLDNSAYFSNPYLAKYFMQPYLPAYNDDGSTFLGNDLALYNPLYVMENNIYQNVTTRITTNNDLSWKIMDNLTFKTKFSADYIVSDYKQYADSEYGDSGDTGGYLYELNTQRFNWVTQNSLQYKLQIANDHNLEINLIQEYQKNKTNVIGAEGEGFSSQNLQTMDSAGTILGGYGTYTDWMIGSYLGLFNYSYSNKYYLDATYRREASSRFPSDNRWGNFWSVGGAWNIYNEAFMEDVNFVSNLRLRGSFGVNGNTGNGINEYQSLLAYDADYGGQAGSYTSSFGNSNLSWEKNEILDLGFEFGFLDDKISGNFSYFNRTTKDLLLDVPLSFTSGSESQIQNVGEMTNKGIEVELNFDIIRSQDLNFSIGGNLATVENEVTKMAPSSTGEQSTIESGTRKVEVGHAVYSWNMQKWAGVDPDTGNPLWYINGKDGETTNDYSSAEKAYQGESALPTFTAGLNTHLDYKGFYLDASFYYAAGHKVYEDWAFYTYHQYYGLYYYQNVDVMMDRWQQSGDITDVPRLGTDSALNNSSSTSTRFLYDGDYLRLKDLVLGYTIPETISSKMGMTSVKAYIRGTNLFTWVKDDRLKYDPEVQASGFTRLSSPPTKSITIGFNFNF